MTKVGIFRNGTQRTYTVSSVTESSEDDEKVDGTKVFTSPNEYKAAMDAIKGMRLGPSFVIASEAVVITCRYCSCKPSATQRTRSHQRPTDVGNHGSFG